jgi:ABC-type sugar transport system ATPase subunit
VAITKWLASRPELFILNDPTRGIDVGTKSDIYNLVAEWAGQGHTILFTSSEIEEILGICDRVFVLHKGEIIRECACDNTDKEEVMRYVLGGDVLSEGIA